MDQLPSPVQELIKAKHFSVEDVTVTSRYFFILGTQAKERRLMKVAKGAVQHSLNQRNLVLWTNAMQKTIHKDAQFRIAPIIEDGYIDETWHWLIMPYIEGTPFATIGEDGVSHLMIDNPEKVFPSIIALMKHIDRVPGASIRGIDARYSYKPKSKLVLLETAISKARNNTPYLAELLQLINTNYQHLKTTNAHSDITETNLIVTPQDVPVLIDAEFAEAYNYEHYDAVEFYNRLFTRLSMPELDNKL